MQVQQPAGMVQRALSGTASSSPCCDAGQLPGSAGDAAACAAWKGRDDSPATGCASSALSMSSGICSGGCQGSPARPFIGCTGCGRNTSAGAGSRRRACSSSIWYVRLSLVLLLRMLLSHAVLAGAADAVRVPYAYAAGWPLSGHQLQQDQGVVNEGRRLLWSLEQQQQQQLEGGEGRAQGGGGLGQAQDTTALTEDRKPGQHSALERRQASSWKWSHTKSQKPPAPSSVAEAKALVAHDAQQCEPSRAMARDPDMHINCLHLNKVCIDQQTFITYDPRYQPSVSQDKPPPFPIDDMVYNWPSASGNGDKFYSGWNLKPAPVYIRPNTSEEASQDLRQPMFSACTHPLIMWTRWLFNVGETFEAPYAKLFHLVRTDLVDPSMSLVVATPGGMRLPHYAKLFFQSIFQREVTTLANLSERGLEGTPSNATKEGLHHRCFEKVSLCKIKNRYELEMCAAGQHLLKTYAPLLPSVQGLYGQEEGEEGQATLKVLVSSRPNAPSRMLLNEQELLEQCNAWQLPEGGIGRYRRVRCVSHVFGRDIFRDMAVARVSDVLLCIHGAACYHAFYMRAGSSLLEVLPYRFPLAWAYIYYAKFMEFEKKVFYWSVVIQDKANSEPSTFERDKWPSVRSDNAMYGRERHVRLPWAALERQLMGIMQVGGDQAAYAKRYRACTNAISDSLQPIKDKPDAGKLGWAKWKAPQAQGRESGVVSEADNGDSDGDGDDMQVVADGSTSSDGEDLRQDDDAR